MDKRWKDKRIIHGITGGIAAYKGAYLTSAMSKLGAQVQVIMTPNSLEFVGFRTFESLSGNYVMYNNDHPYWKRASHVEAAKWADIMVIAPLTANTLAKMVNGIADNILLDTYLAFDKPVLVVPAMNSVMYDHPSTQRNFELLSKYPGHIIVPPDHGYLACGDIGKGRFPDIEKIVDYIEFTFVKDKPLKGKTVIVTAGPTRHFIDDVRFISNPSSGKMGYELAREAWILGADVILLLGRGSRVSPPHFAQVVYFDTALQLLESLEKYASEADILIMAAAVGDFIPEYRKGKLNRREGSMTLTLLPSPDVIRTIKEKYPSLYVVGFAAETSTNLDRAFNKLREKGINAIVYNDVSRKDIGFDSEYNEVYLIFNDGTRKKLGYMTKRDISRGVWQEVSKYVSNG